MRLGERVLFREEQTLYQFFFVVPVSPILTKTRTSKHEE